MEEGGTDALVTVSSHHHQHDCRHQHHCHHRHHCHHYTIIHIIVKTKTKAANEVTGACNLLLALQFTLSGQTFSAGESQGWLACIWSGPQKLSTGYLHSHKKV